MAKINILPSKVYNRIAAGEVVDRPCSVVKELVENSIDAGATQIEIHIEKGGKQLIRVIDNGCGIERDDLQSAFLPHATSKISSADDLDNIMTLGFRGEAIASISAVSQMSITSKTEEGKCYKLSCNGGELGQIVEASGEKGTDVSVEMLFYHTPVRLGFLKSDKVEETEITNFVSHFILNRSDIAFLYFVDGKKVLQSFGEGDESAMVCVYGASILSECFCIDVKKHGIRMYGYIGNQNFSKPNKSYQSVFLNGRYIVNATIAMATSAAYNNYLMKRQYPFYVLHIDMPTEIVDVNVHPNKADVRFVNNQIIYGYVYSALSAVLDGQAKGMEYIVKMPQTGIFETPVSVAEKSLKTSSEKTSVSTRENTATLMPTAGFVGFTYEEAKKEVEASAPAFVAKKKGVELPFADIEEVAEKEEEEKKEEKPSSPYPKGFIPIDQIGPYVPQKLPDNAVKVKRSTRKTGAEKLHQQYPDLFFERPLIRVHDPAYEQALKESQAAEEGFAANKKFLEELERKNKQSRIDVTNCVYAGKLFNTYLMYELQDSVYVIDQHAAHERLIFNRLKEQMENRTIIRQPMLVPFVMNLNAFEGEFLRENLQSIQDIGFVLSETAENRFEVSEIPLDLQNINLTSFFNDILGDVGGYRAIKLDTLLKDKLASAACKAAVKGGMDLTREEIDALFALMDGDMSLKCPHGRPVVVKLTKTELEKMFKRIV